LYELVSKIVDEEFQRDRKIGWGEAASIKEALSHFEISLQSDFGTRDTFIVSQKAAFSTTVLAEQGQTAVSEQCLILVPEIAFDLADGCRCLAFELPTAAAFHLFRAVEAMVKSYGESIRKKPFTTQEKKRGLGGYANCLKQTSLHVDKRIINSIEQIASLHRNPTMHPDMRISKTEIMSTLGMVISLIETLALDWKRREDTPETPLIDILPDDSKVSALIEDESGKPESGEDGLVRQVNSGDARGVAVKTPRRRKSEPKAKNAN